MKKHSRSFSALTKLIVSLLTILFLLCSCGGELDGTWESTSDEDTRIRFSGENVRISYDDFRIEGTYELTDDGTIVFRLTDENGNKYKIQAFLTYDKRNKIITLKNPKGETETFVK